MKKYFIILSLIASLFLLGQTARAQVYACTDAVYFTSNSNSNVYRYTPSTNAITQVGGTTLSAGTAASAITPTGSRLYYADNVATNSNLRYNSGGNTNAIASLLSGISGTQRAAIAPNGTGYFMVGIVPTAGNYYRFTTGGATSTVTGPFTLTVSPATAPAIARGGDIAFDANGIAYLLDQTKNFYQIDFTTNVATYLGAITGMGTESPNGLGFSGTTLYASTLNNLIYRVNLATRVATQVTPTSTVSGFTQNDIATCFYPTTLAPSVAATKAWRNVTKGDPATFTTSTTANLGDTIEYRVVVRNSGTIASGDTNLQDTIPAGVTYVANSTTLNGAAVTDNAGTGNAAFSFGTVKNINSPTQSAGVLTVDATPTTLTDNEAVIVFRVTINNPLDGANPIPNTATVNFTGASAAVSSNTVNTPVNLPELQIGKTHTGNFTVGSTGTYTLTVTNTGAAPSAGAITLTDTLPAGLTVNNGAAGALAAGGTNGANWACSSNNTSPQIITCTSSNAITNVAPNNQSVFTLSVSVTTAAAVGINSVTNSVRLAGGGDSNTTNNTTTDAATVLSPDLTIGKTHTGNFTRGSTGVYTITVTNSGTTATSGTITVTDNLPLGLSVNGGAAGAVVLSGANAGSWTCSANAAAPQVITCTSTAAISNAAPANTSVFNLTVAVAASAPATVTNTASVSSGSEATANATNNNASDPTAIGSTPPVVGLLKSCTTIVIVSGSPTNAVCSDAPRLSGTDLTYTIQFTNTGGQAATSLIVLDAIPQNTDFKLGTAAVVSPTGLTLTIEYSNNYDAGNPAAATWTYTPTSAAGGAPPAYDRQVKAIRWRASAGALPKNAPDNTGNVSFTVRIR